MDCKNHKTRDAEQETHPCFAVNCNEYARIHLPVAPKCNIQCNYCLRKYCCANECRPGVTARVMTPVQGMEWFVQVRKQMPNLTVAGIAGPGDALANWPEVEETLRRVRSVDNDVKLCLSTNGLLLPYYVEHLNEMGVQYLTVTVNAIIAQTATKIYEFVEFDGIKYKSAAAIKVFMTQQWAGIEKAKKLGLHVKINTVAVPGINIGEIPEIARKAASYHCDVMNVIPMLPVTGSRFSSLAAPKDDLIHELRTKCNVFIRQMTHCTRCRADAVGTLQMEKRLMGALTKDVCKS